MPSDVRAADGTAAERYKVPSVVLMENAARAAADAAEAMARGDGRSSYSRATATTAATASRRHVISCCAGIA